MIKAQVKEEYTVTCLNERGADSKDQTTVYNQKLNLKKCRKCKYFTRFNKKNLTVSCKYKQRDL